MATYSEWLWEERTDRLERFVTDLAGAASTVMTVIGDRLGLYEAWHGDERRNADGKWHDEKSGLAGHGLLRGFRFDSRIGREREGPAGQAGA